MHFISAYVAASWLTTDCASVGKAYPDIKCFSPNHGSRSSQEAFMHQVTAVMLRLSSHEPRNPDTGKQHAPSKAAWEARQATMIKLLATLAWLNTDGEHHVEEDQHNETMYAKCKKQLWDLLDFLLTDHFDNPELDLIKVELLCLQLCCSVNSHDAHQAAWKHTHCTCLFC